MQATCEPGHIHLSPSSADVLLLNLPEGLVLEPRGETFIKGRVSGGGPNTA